LEKKDEGENRSAAQLTRLGEGRLGMQKEERGEDDGRGEEKKGIRKGG